MRRRDFLKAAGCSAIALVLPGCSAVNLSSDTQSPIDASRGNAKKDSQKKRPNVLMIAVDDMRDWVGYLDACPAEVKTPNIDRIAAGGTAFTRAYTASSVCCPSRAAVLTGQMPSTSGIYRNEQFWKPNAPDIYSIPSYFRKHGYIAVGAGKLFHHVPGHNPPGEWDAYYRNRFLDNAWAYAKCNYMPFTPKAPTPKGFPYSGIRFPFAENDWGVLPKPEAKYDDTMVFQYGIDFLGKKHNRPFFLACGTFRPHMPWYVPRKYFDMYPLESIKFPATRKNDLDDVPAGGQKMARAKRNTLNMVRKKGKWAEAVQAYLASISYADAQVGRLIDALKSSEYADNTIVIFWSDHGWHFGEKEHWHKCTLWEVATRVPFAVSSPNHGAPRQKCDRPVSLVDIFPTLIDLCDLPPLRDQKLDGISLKPLIENPEAAREKPAVTELYRGNAAVRTERYRYIRYADGAEELYDHRNDPNEWNNIASRPESKEVIRSLAKHLPGKWRENALTNKAYIFKTDPNGTDISIIS